MKKLTHQGVEYHQIAGTPLYFVSRQGQVYALALKRLVPQSTTSAGYCQVGITDAVGRRVTKKVHRLVAQQFIPNPEGKPTVNHKYGDKSDNHVDNLEWATMSEQQLHANAFGLTNNKRGEENQNFGRTHSEEARRKMSEQKKGAKHPKHNGRYQTPGGEFESSYAAAEALGEHPRTVHRRCHNPKMAPKGWSFKPAAKFVR